MTFKDRIALVYMLTASTLIAVVFFIIYFIVSTTVYSNLDTALIYEAQKHLKDIIVKNDSLKFDDQAIRNEREHKEAEVLPFFLQIVDTAGNLIQKSSNLKGQMLTFHRDVGVRKCFNCELNGKAIRQIQIPIKRNDKILGYFITAVSLEGTKLVVDNLRKVLLVLFPVILAFLFFIARFLADKNIKPIVNIIETTNRITKHNLSERVKLPKARDELYILAQAINELLDRIQSAFEREKQFTNDASHELRTPLSVIKGTLEVLVRKPRKEQEYKEKIKYCISEINDMSERVDQLLMLARFDKANISLKKVPLPVISLIDNSIHRHRKLIEKKNIHIEIKGEQDLTVTTDPFYIDMIMDNIISNAVKYSPLESTVAIRSHKENGKVIIEVRDEGGGIKEDDIQSVFNPFFRSEPLNHKHITGSGLGLSIVKKVSEVLGIEVRLENQPGKGLNVQIIF